MLKSLLTPKIQGFMKDIVLYNMERFVEFDTHVMFMAVKSMVSDKIARQIMLTTVVKKEGRDVVV